MTRTDHHETTTTPRARRTIVIAAGAAAAIGLAFAGGTVAGALFTSQATVGGQSASTATVEIDAATATASAPIALTDMLPGDTESTTIELENTGTVGVYYTVRIVEVVGGDADLADELEVTVAVGALSETRTLSEWQDGALQVGTALAASGTVDVTVSVELPLGADDSLQGLGAGFSVQFDAIQQRNVTAPTAGWIAD